MISFISNTRIWKVLVTIVCDIRFYMFGIILTGDSSYKIKGPRVRQILDILEPGDVLMRRYDHYIRTLFTPGFWGHCAHYVGDNEVIHMGGEGIKKEDILTFLRADHIAILRCNDKELIPMSIKLSKDLYDKDVDYDYAFESDNETFYCSEHIWHIFGKSKEIIFDKYILPDNIHCSLFDIVWIDEESKKQLIKKNITNVIIEGN